MRAPTLALLAAMIAGAAFAEPARETGPAKTIQCIEADGSSIPAACHTPASRLDGREYICTCPSGGRRVDVAVCAKDQAPPPDSRALNAARRTAMRDGSLIGDTVDGRPICVAPRGG